MSRRQRAECDSIPTIPSCSVLSSLDHFPSPLLASFPAPSPSFLRCPLLQDRVLLSRGMMEGLLPEVLPTHIPPPTEPPQGQVHSSTLSPPTRDVSQQELCLEMNVIDQIDHQACDAFDRINPPQVCPGSTGAQSAVHEIPQESCARRTGSETVEGVGELNDRPEEEAGRRSVAAKTTSTGVKSKHKLFNRKKHPWSNRRTPAAVDLPDGGMMRSAIPMEIPRSSSPRGRAGLRGK